MAAKTLPPSILIALGLIGCGPCLNIAVPTPEADTDTDADTDADADTATDTDTGTGPCLDIAFTADTGVGPCLSPPLETSDTSDTADTGAPPSAAARSSTVIQALIDAGVLPPDVAARVKRDDP